MSAKQAINEKLQGVVVLLITTLRKVYWSVGARPIDVQVERVRQHHVT